MPTSTACSPPRGTIWLQLIAPRGGFRIVRLRSEASSLGVEDMWAEDARGGLVDLDVAAVELTGDRKHCGTLTLQHTLTHAHGVIRPSTLAITVITVAASGTWRWRNRGAVRRGAQRPRTGGCRWASGGGFPRRGAGSRLETERFRQFRERE